MYTELMIKIKMYFIYLSKIKVVSISKKLQIIKEYLKSTLFS